MRETIFGSKSIYFLRGEHSVEIRYSRNNWPEGQTVLQDLLVDGETILDDASPQLLEWAQKEAEEDWQ